MVDEKVTSPQKCSRTSWCTGMAHAVQGPGSEVPFLRDGGVSDGAPRRRVPAVRRSLRLRAQRVPVVRRAYRLVLEGSAMRNHPDGFPRDGLAPIPQVPTVRSLAPWVEALYDAHGAGCCLHIVLDDATVERDSVDFCSGEAYRDGHHACAELARALRRMRLVDRLRVRDWCRPRLVIRPNVGMTVESVEIVDSTTLSIKITSRN